MTAHGLQNFVASVVMGFNTYGISLLVSYLAFLIFPLWGHLQPTIPVYLGHPFRLPILEWQCGCSLLISVIDLHVKKVL